MLSNKQTRLDQIESEILKKNVCPDLAQTANRLVMGAGNPDASIVFIGEAPGKKEDEEGIPFVGAAGKFLDEMLSSIGMNREDIYITNIVKYRPPDNRDPKLEEKKAFFPHLTSQLGVIEPKIIVPLGRHAMNAFLPDFVISEVHGKAFRRKLTIDGLNTEVVFVPLYHPAAALYNGSLRKTLLEDFSGLPSIINSIEK